MEKQCMRKNTMVQCNEQKFLPIQLRIAFQHQLDTIKLMIRPFYFLWHFVYFALLLIFLRLFYRLFLFPSHWPCCDARMTFIIQFLYLFCCSLQNFDGFQVGQVVDCNWLRSMLLFLNISSVYLEQGMNIWIYIQASMSGFCT